MTVATPAVRHRAAVLGHPVAHSLSPVLHHAAYAALGLDDWAYERRDLTEPEVAGFLAGLDETWAGLSVTMPLKKAVLPLLDEVDPLAEALGVVNTIVVRRHGRDRTLAGANTDVHGIVAALREAAGGGDIVGPAVLLGGGATAVSALAALAALGQPHPTVVAISAEHDGVRRAGGRLGVEPQVAPWEDGAEALADAALVVSTVPVGAADPFAAALPSSPVPPGGLLLDVVYAPWPTPLARAWAARGGLVTPGWLMLLHQAAEQVRLMTGRPAPLEQMRAALVAALEARAGGG